MALLMLLKRMNSVATESGSMLPTNVRSPLMAFARHSGPGPRKSPAFPHAVIEEAMGHQVGSQVERAYRRTDVLEKRRELMAALSTYCEP